PRPQQLLPVSAAGGGRRCCAFFCASPIYGSAEDFMLLLDITVSREVTPAAKQQIGETRKKRLAQRLAFFRFDLSFGV
ncbi:hypothetical protein LKD23_10810, partial [Faecalibacterium sp. CLA-AA-H233]